MGKNSIKEGIERLEVCLTRGLNEVLNDIRDDVIIAGKYSHLVEVNNNKIQGEIFNDYDTKTYPTKQG